MKNLLLAIFAIGFASTVEAQNPKKYNVGDLVRVIGKRDFDRHSHCNVEWVGKNGKVNKNKTLGGVYRIDREFVRSNCSYNSYFLRYVDSDEVVGASTQYPNEWQFVPHWLEPAEKPDPPVVVGSGSTNSIEAIIGREVSRAVGRILKAELDRRSKMLDEVSAKFEEVRNLAEELSQSIESLTESIESATEKVREIRKDFQ